MKKIFSVLILFVFVIKISAQDNNAHTRISILTCGPGDELYSLFGHTAIRIFDSTTHVDVVYNWGGFTFHQPNFYLHFVQGTLLYFSTSDNFNDFMYEYVIDHRSVYEQVLNLDSTAKKNIIDAVIFNSTGDNKFYKYDGFIDNCTTRIKNIVYDNLKTATITANIIPDGTTSRELMHYYLEKGNQLWTELGLDILVGSEIDKKISNDEAMFLPEFFMKGLNNSEYNAAPLVKSFTTILKGGEQQTPSWKYFPLAITSAICLFIFFISTLKTKWSKSVIKFVDVLLLYITGLLGILLLFMWFATDHIECKNNFNLAWAFPFNFFIAFFMIKKPAWLSNYFFITAVITAIFIAVWFWLPQQINITLLPVVILLLNRYVNLANNFRRTA
ncbi:MAG: DUF4105 domain-containing protein [Parafilimonas sp.]